MTHSNEKMVRATGLLVIEAINSNPNGDPDRESDPRQRPDGRGEISPVSFKRKIRDLVEDKEGPVWNAVKDMFQPPLSPEKHYILESRGRDRKQVEEDMKNKSFVSKYWDARLFGNTFLEKEASTFIKTGVAQFALAVSLAPIEIERLTNTNKAGVQEGKDRGMAPMAYRIVPHAVYTMPFFINPTAAQKSGCTQRDVDLLLKLIPYAYTHSASYIRPMVGIRHAWYIEHKSPLGSCSDFELIAALTPKKKDRPNEPSLTWDDYEVPSELPASLKTKVASVRDLMADLG
jgi:Cas7 group CRISPR-associated protein Csh2